ncbi:MAG: VCBS domain-containing protein [Roseovarius sp.]|nr:VCBS domain-containing protein [Roseovarius sp.]
MGFPVPDTGSVTEDDDVGGVLTVSGDIDYRWFDDTGDWTAETITGAYGSQLVIDEDGNWTYTADNSNPRDPGARHRRDADRGLQRQLGGRCLDRHDHHPRGGRAALFCRRHAHRHAPGAPAGGKPACRRQGADARSW